MVENFSPNLMGRVEWPVSSAKKNDSKLCALALNSRLDYNFNDALKNEFRLNFEYLSGNDNKDQNFDPLWAAGRSSPSSTFTPTPRKPASPTPPTSSASGASYLVKPTSILQPGNSTITPSSPTIMSKTPRPAFVGDGNFRGHLFSAILRYQFNSHVAGTSGANTWFPATSTPTRIATMRSIFALKWC